IRNVYLKVHKMIKDNKINELTLSFPKIGYLFSETTANPFAYRKSMELLPEIMNGNVLIFCLYGSTQERMKNNIRP
ncbi:28188_t:CDS:2, partial [Gigaspora margarita]